MLERLREYWLPLLLFLATLGIAGILAGLVIVTPHFGPVSNPEWLRLFAEDAIVRRTAVASALGLAVTACVFFRPRGILLARKPRSRKAPGQIAGA